MLIYSWHSKIVYKEVPEYNIIIDDNVTMKEFFSLYELQDIKDNVYIVRDKDWDK